MDVQPHQQHQQPPSHSHGGKPREPLSDEAVFADAVNLTGAAAETTGATAERGIFEVIDNKEIYGTLTRELREAFSDEKDMTWSKLEKLPYLTGVVKEALR
jgi:cytochrome P450